MTALPPIVHWLGVALFVVTGLCAAIDLCWQMRRPRRRHMSPFSNGGEQP